jgi:hypothetical protein
MMPSIRKAACNALADFQRLKSKRGPKKHVFETWFAWALMPIYEQITGRKATAHFGPGYSREMRERWAGRPTPFVRFAAECLRPIDREAVSPDLAEAIHSLIRDRG